MLRGTAIPPLVMAGINAYVAFHYVAIYLRVRRSREHLSFALLALTVFLYCTCCVGLYNASSPAEGRPWQMAQHLVLTLAAPALLFFMANYTGRAYRRFIVAVILGYAGVLVAAIIGGRGLAFSDVPAIKHVLLPFGLSVTYNEMASGPLVAVHDIISLSVFAYAFMAIADLSRRGEHRRAVRLGVATVLLFVAAVNDASLGHGLIRSIYLIEYAFMGMVVMMGNTLFGELLRAATVQEALRESEQKYRRLFATVPDPIVVFDTATREFVDVNESAERLYGFSRNEFLRMKQRDITAEPEESERSIQETLAGKRHRVDLRYHRKKDGTVFPVEISPGEFVLGGRRVLCGVIRDISERTRAAEVLQREKERFQLLVESAPYAVVAITGDGTFEFINRKFTDVFGYELADVPNQASWREFAYPDPDYRKHVADTWKHDKENGRVGVAGARTFTVRCKDGSDKLVVFHSAELSSGSTMMTCEDVTERRRAEEALRESELHFRTLAETASVGILIAQGEHFTYANPAARSIVGFSSRELLDMRFWETIHPDFQGMVRSRAGARLAGATDLPSRYEIKIITKAGTGRWVDLTSGRISLEGRSGLLVTIADITEERRLRDLQAAIYEISEATQAAASLDELFRSIHAIIGRLMAAQNFYISLYDPIANLISFPYFVDEEDQPPQSRRPGRGLTEYILRTGGPLLATPEVFEELSRRGEVESVGAPSIDWLGVPLIVGDKPIGALVVQTYTEGVRYGEGEKEILGFVSTQVAQAIERKRAEETLRTSEAKLRALFAAMTDVILVLDGEGRYVEIAPTNPALLYKPPEEIIGRRLDEVFPPEQAKLFLDYVTRALETRQNLTVEYSLPIGGRELFFSMVLSPMLGDRVMCVARDVTERRRADEALRESEERFQRAFEHAAVGMALVGLDGRWLKVNRALCEVIGYSESEMLAMTFQEITHPDDLGRDLAHLKQMVTGETRNYQTEKRYFHKRGDVVWVLLSASLVRNREGRPLYFVSQFQDLTGRKLAEAELLQAQKMEAVGQLAGGVAHDFNNLLQAMLSHTQLLRATAKDPARVAATAAELEQQIMRGAAFARQLLLFSRRESAKRERLDLNEVVEHATQMLRRLVREDIAFAVELAAETLPVQADHGQLDQVLVNLVVNASDAMPQGGSITLRTGRDEGKVWVEVEDSGHGIADEIVSRIFEPFFTTKGVGKGTGLGLSVVHGIVASHGGTVEVRSRVGVGTTFHVALPREGSGSFPKVEEPIALDDMPPGHGERVLVVEDEESARQGISEILTLLGYEVVAVGSAEEAGLLPRESAFDLLLTDLILPGAHGGELARRLLERWPRIEIIIMSGYTDDEPMRRGISHGNVRFLQKPFDMGALAREVRTALSRQR